MTEQQEKIFQEMVYCKKQLNDLETMFLKYIHKLGGEKYTKFKTEQEQKIFDDFKENLKNYYDAQIDKLLAQLTEKSAAQFDCIKLS